MKTLFAVALVLMMAGTTMAETLLRAEKMTDAEYTELKMAQIAINAAKIEMENVKHKIAVAHEMKAEQWMEWSSRVDFDGDYILLYHTNNMEIMSRFK